MGHCKKCGKHGKKKDICKAKIHKAKIYELKACEADIEEAKIEELNADQANIEKAKIGELEVDTLDIKEVKFDKIEVNEANITNANIINLEADEAKIKNGEMENLTIDNLQSINATIDNLNLNNGQVNGVLTGNPNLIPSEVRSFPIPPGPYAIDHFQVGKDNVQLRAPEKWRVDQFVDKDLMVDGVQTVEVDGVEYFGRMENGRVIYLTYPLPLNLDFYVPSKRTNTKEPYNLFPDNSEEYYGVTNLPLNVAIQGTHFFEFDGPAGAPGLVEADRPGNIFADFFLEVPDENSFANRVNDTPIEEWSDLQGVFLLDDLEVDAYERLFEAKENLKPYVINTDIEGYGPYNFLVATYSPPITEPIIAPGVNAVPLNACGEVTNDVDGKIVLCQRGACRFDEKTGNITTKGGIATIVYQNESGPPIIMGGDPVSGAGPSVMISREDGVRLRDAIDQGAIVTIEEREATGANFGDIDGAYKIMSKIMGSYGVPVGTPGNNSVPLDLREKAFDLMYGSSNIQLIQQFKGYSRKHPAKSDKEDGVYSPKYEFTTIDLAGRGLLPFVILAEPGDMTSVTALAEHLVSFGMGACIYNVSYNLSYNRVPGKVRSANQIIADGNCFPDVVALECLTFADNNAYYSVHADSATGDNRGYILSMGYEYNVNNTNTQTTSYQFNEDIVNEIVDCIRSAKDLSGRPLSDYLFVDGEIGCWGYSGGSNILNGLHAYVNNVNPNLFAVGVAGDIVLSFPYVNGDFDGLYDPAGSTFPGGLNYPVMFMEPEVDAYDVTYLDPRGVVGARKSLQTIIRKTPLEIRSNSIFMEMSQKFHISSANAYYTGGVEYLYLNPDNQNAPSLPQFPNFDTDPVWGFGVDSNLEGNVSSSALNAIGIYFRTMFQTDTIRFNALNYLPFKFDICPWDIPAADDYQWQSREWNMDLGGRYEMYTTASKNNIDFQIGSIGEGEVKNVEFELTDPNVSTLTVTVNWSNSNTDIDVFLYSPDDTLVGKSESTTKPEILSVDISNVINRVGTWRVELLSFSGPTTNYSVTVEGGEYRVVIGNESDPANAQLGVSTGTINMKNLPTSPDGLESGDLWVDDGNLRIVQN